jgi:hypothetical protein
LSFGHVSGPGTYATTVTRPDLFRNYLIQQIELLIRNHGVSVDVGPSDTPIPVHFAVAGNPGGRRAAGGRDGLQLARRVRRAGPGHHQRRHRQRHADAL